MTHGIDTGFLVAAEVLGHPVHPSARAKLQQFRAAGDQFAFAAQVLAEFVHVVTDPRRFSQPLTMADALARAEAWWYSPEVVQLSPDGPTLAVFLAWMRQHQLGRKRILDTLLAATFNAKGITSVLTTDPGDFAVLGGFNCVAP
jgi:predicted nucleic acid-binding protein